MVEETTGDGPRKITRHTFDCLDFRGATERRDRGVGRDRRAPADHAGGLLGASHRRATSRQSELASGSGPVSRAISQQRARTGPSRAAGSRQHGGELVRVDSDGGLSRQDDRRPIPLESHRRTMVKHRSAS